MDSFLDDWLVFRLAVWRVARIAYSEEACVDGLDDELATLQIGLSNYLYFIEIALQNIKFAVSVIFRDGRRLYNAKDSFVFIFKQFTSQ